MSGLINRDISQYNKWDAEDIICWKDYEKIKNAINIIRDNLSINNIKCSEVIIDLEKLYSLDEDEFVADLKRQIKIWKEEQHE